MDNLALLTQAVDGWTRIHGFELVDVPWLPRRSLAATVRRLGADIARRPGAPGAAAGFLDLWEKGALPTAPGYVAWRPCVCDAPDDGDCQPYGSVTLELFTPVASAEEGREVLVTVICRAKLLLSSLAAKLGEPCVRFTVDDVSEHRRRLLLNKVAVGSFGMRQACAVGYVYGTVLVLPGFADAVAAYDLAARSIAQVQAPRRSRWDWLTRDGTRAASPRGVESEAAAR